MRLTCFGHAVFALAVAGFGVVSLVGGELAYVWQPAPSWFPGHPALAYASGALLLGCGVGLLFSRTRAPASLVLALCALSSMLLVHLPLIVQKPEEEARWFGLGEMAILIAGAWILFASASLPAARGWRRAVGGARGVRFSRLLFGLALLPIGLSHFVYAEVTAKLVPSWLPGHLAWAYATGAGHLAAALGLLLGVLPRLAATLEALMVSTFVLTIHVPTVVGKPGDGYQWSELCVACFIGGAALLLAHAHRGARWLALGGGEREGETSLPPRESGLGAPPG